MAERWDRFKTDAAELLDDILGRTENPDYDSNWRRRPDVHGPADARTPVTAAMEARAGAGEAQGGSQ
jgi:hypothetical protein